MNELSARWLNRWSALTWSRKTRADGYTLAGVYVVRMDACGSFVFLANNLPRDDEIGGRFGEVMHRLRTMDTYYEPVRC